MEQLIGIFIFLAGVTLAVRLYLLMTAAQLFLEAQTRLVERQHRGLDTE